MNTAKKNDDSEMARFATVPAKPAGMPSSRHWVQSFSLHGVASDGPATPTNILGKGPGPSTERRTIEDVDPRARRAIMEWMSRDRFVKPSLSFVHVALALLVQFAPSIHLLTPHTHAALSCTHGPMALHIEAADPDRSDSPCPICAQLLNGQVVLEATSLANEISFVPVSKPPPLEIRPYLSALKPPDNRGPPRLIQAPAPV